MTVKDIYLEVGKTQGITPHEMEGVLQRACLRAPLNLAAEVPEGYRAEAITMLLGMFTMYRSLSDEQKKELISAVENGLANRN